MSYQGSDDNEVVETVSTNNENNNHHYYVVSDSKSDEEAKKFEGQVQDEIEVSPKTTVNTIVVQTMRIL